MVKSVEILIELNNERYYLDYDKVDGISLNYNINRIQELENLDSSYSQSIKLVNSKNNQKVLGYISNLNIENGSFDPNKKTKATILVDSVSVFDGYLQLLGIEYNDNVISYNAVIYADNANLYSSIENKFLTDLDFSRYNYTYDFSTFLSTATSSADKDAIIFPIIDYGSNWTYNQISGTGSQLGVSASQIDMTELYPATYVKSIVDQIFTDAGYKYESEFLNSYDFKRLIIPFTNEKLLSREEVSINDTFEVFQNGIDPGPSIFTQSIATSLTFKSRYDETSFISDAGTRFNFATQEYTNDNTRKKERFGVDIDLTLHLGSLISTSLTNANGSATSLLVPDLRVDLVFRRQYNSGTRSLDVDPTNDFYRKRIYTSVNSQVSNGDYIGFSYSQVSTNFWIQDKFIKSGGDKNPVGVKYIFPNDIQLDRKVFGYTTSTPTTGQYDLGALYFDMGRLTSTDTLFTPWLDGSRPELLPLFENEKIDVSLNITSGSINITDAFVRTQLINNGFLDGKWFFWSNRNIIVSEVCSFPQLLTTFPGSFGSASNNPQIYDGRTLFNTNGWLQDTSLSYNHTFLNEVSNEAGEGTDIPISLNLPRQIKQIDFLKSIIRMFNLYFEPIKGKINTFKIEPRDDFYSGGTIKDWSNKVDISKNIEVDILSNTQNKEIILKYKEADDFLNEVYQKTFNETYGQFNYIIDNDFITGQKILEVIFNPSVLRFVYNSDIVITSIQKNLNYNQVPDNVGSGIRILYSEVLPLPSNKTISIEGRVFSDYIYAGHFDNPYNPLIDLSFKLPKKLYYDFISDGQSKITYNSLYNLYHRKQFGEVNDKDSRLVKVYINLDQLDIYNFKFNDVIYLYINENINGYFRVNSINEFNPLELNSVMVELIKISYVETNTLITDVNRDTTNLRSNSLILGGQNQYNSDNTIIVGRNNLIDGYNNNVFGDENNLSLINSKVTGSLNTLSGDSINVNGSLNRIDGSLLDIIGSQNIATESNIVKGRLVGDGNTIKQSIDKLQITGDNNIVGDTSSISKLENIYIFGDNNSIQQDVNNVVLFGNSATISNSNTFIINGLDFETEKLIVNGKTTNTFTDVDDYIIYGKNNQVVNGFDNIISKVAAVGDGNYIYSLTDDSQKFLMGDFNQLITNTASFMMLIGINNDVIGLKDSFVFGSNNGFNTNLQPGLFQNNYVLGNSNVATFNPFFGPGFNKNIVVGDSNTFPSIIRPFENNITIGNSNNFEHRNNLFTASGYNKNLVIGDTNNFTMPAQKSIIIGDNNTEFPIRNAVFASSSIIIGNNNKLGSSDSIVQENILQNDFVLGDNNFVGFSKYSKVLGKDNSLRSDYTTLDGESNNINIVPYGTTFSTFNKNINIRGNNNNITYGGSVSHSIFGSDPVISGRFKDIKYVVDPTMNILGSRQGISLGPILNPRKVVGYTYSFGVNPPIFTANIITNNNLYDVFSYSTAIPNRMINASQNLVDLVSYNQNAGLNTYITNRVGSLVKTKSEGLSASREPIKNYPYELASDEDYSSYNVNYIESQSVTSNFTFSSLFRLENGLSKDDNLLVTNSIDTLPHNYIINSNDSYNGNFDATYSLQTTYKRFNTNYTNYGTASTKEILSYFRLTKNVGSDNPPIIPYYKLDIKSTILFGTATQSSNFLLQSPAREQEDTLFINYDNSIGPVTYSTFGFTYSVVNKSNNALNAVPPTIQYSPISSGSNRLLEIKYIDNTIGARVYDMYVHIEITAYYMDWKNKYTKKEIPY